ncbi:MAG: hypothetical protein ACE5OZ_05665 [Candidatus Heimdallarchaeota archaeon]
MAGSEALADTSITKIRATSLDQLIQILEISFIFLLSFSLITLLDAAFIELDLYEPIATDFLGEEGIGSLDGGNFEAIVRITLIFNLLLFTFSLLFGLWIRRTRDGWSWAQLGYTYQTPGYNFRSLTLRAILLGLIAIIIWFAILTPLVYVDSGSDLDQAFLFHAYHSNGDLFSLEQLNAEWYFGVVEMGFIWPLSAGFFFFAYCHNSLKARFGPGIANILSSLFYVFYLAFFFVILGPGKLKQIPDTVQEPMFWGMMIAFFIVLYIFFSAFAETESVVLPFLANFVFNVGLTVLKAFNALTFSEASPLMLLPFLLTLAIVVVWFVLKEEDFSTLKLGLNHLKDAFRGEKARIKSFLSLIGIVFLFITLAFLIPGILEHVIIAEPENYEKSFKAFVYAFMYIVMIGIAIIILTYEPTKVYDVVLVHNLSGLPIASRIELMQSDEALISGFFSAISAVSKELDDTEKTDLRSIKRGDREILIEDGVFTRIIALADRDQSRIRQSMLTLQRTFEATHAKNLAEWIGDRDAIPEAKDFVKSVGALSIRFDIPQQTRWIGVLTLVLTPLMISLIGLI